MENKTHTTSLAMTSTIFKEIMFIGHFNNRSKVHPKQVFALLMSTDLEIEQILTGLTSIPPFAPIKQILIGMTSIPPHAPIKQILTGLTSIPSPAPIEQILTHLTNVPPYAPVEQILEALNTISLDVPYTSIPVERILRTLNTISLVIPSFLILSNDYGNCYTRHIQEIRYGFFTQVQATPSIEDYLL